MKAIKRAAKKNRGTMDEQKIFSDLVAKTRNLEISMMAISNRLALAEAFNSQLAKDKLIYRMC